MELTPELVESIARKVVEAMSARTAAAHGPQALLIGDGDWSALREHCVLEDAQAYEAAGNLERYDFVLLDGVAPAFLADLALGRGSCPGARAVSEALLTGKPVYLASEGLVHRGCQRQANPRYYAMLEEYAAQLGRFGVCVESRAALTQLLTHTQRPSMGMEASKMENSAPKAMQTPKTAEPGLLTAEAARRLCKDCTDVLRVAAGTVVTPLARDVLREKKIRLEEVETC